MGIPNSKRSGGPRSPQGIASASRNSFKTGVAAAGWQDPREEAQYEELLEQLLEHYPRADFMMVLLLKRLATNWVKLDRLERADNALHQRARLFAQELARQRLESSVAGLLPDTQVGHASEAAIAVDAALAPVEWTNAIERGRITLERQIMRLVAQIDRMQQSERAARTEGLTLVEQAGADVSDAMLVRRRA
jgi:hypothetical protein